MATLAKQSASHREFKYPVRSVDVKATVNGNALVFVNFQKNKAEPGFMVPYSFIGKTKTLKVIDESEFWDVKIKTLKPCKNPEIQITYDPCSACDAGDNLTGRLGFIEEDLTWFFWPDDPKDP